MKLHAGALVAPAENGDLPHELGEGDNRDEEEYLLYKHVGQVVRSHLVLDGVAIGEADTVACVAARALLDHLGDDLLSDADSVVLETTLARLDLLLHEG